MKKKIIVTGATGLIGKKLCDELICKGNDVYIFTRDVLSAKKIISTATDYINWDYKNPELWKQHIEGKDAVIHLAGASVAGKRWNDEYKRVIRDSRIVSTKNLAEAIVQCEIKPKAFLTSSGSGYYGNRGNEILGENDNGGKDFLAQVCKDWESSASIVESKGVRRVSIRTGIVLSNQEGALKKMLLPFKLFVGGPLGSGKQWFPWIHIDDIVNLYIHSIENESVKGAINASSPEQISMKDFAKTLGKVLKRPSLFPVPELVLKVVIGEVASEIISSQRLDVSKVLNTGFKFRFEKLENALGDLLLKKSNS
ncbi:MAG: TIGR01777 family protein [Ignavibacteriales bacterium]|nr:MAG: TIGR01777 family protein [Ignavibacteriales bacterium]